MIKRYIEKSIDWVLIDFPLLELKWLLISDEDEMYDKYKDFKI